MRKIGEDGDEDDVEEGRNQEIWCKIRRGGRGDKTAVGVGVEEEGCGRDGMGRRRDAGKVLKAREVTGTRGRQHDMVQARRARNRDGMKESNEYSPLGLTRPIVAVGWACALPRC